MLDTKDKENLVKAKKTAEQLVADLRELVKSDNLFMSDAALEMIKHVAVTGNMLNRIDSYPSKNKE